MPSRFSTWPGNIRAGVKPMRSASRSEAPLAASAIHSSLVSFRHLLHRARA
ncbi:hypothetical protein [Saccharopolyspora terrae]|uniref:hypothetical protein n=1 Tax=Saccharopolyspora terrae TaxID=2530384 RepID=UPI001404273C|nr:hypothetical protein [Saccharopolyspora terrae]